MNKHQFVVYWNKDGQYIKNGHRRDGFPTYAEAFNWAIKQVMSGFNFGVYQEQAECQKPSIPAKSPMRISLHTKQVFNFK